MKARHTLVISVVALAGAALLGASCGGAGVDEGCSRAGARCPFGCDANLGCVSCLDDGDCGPGAPFCVLGSCESCAVDADCGTGKACYLRDHTCQTKCVANSDCADVPDAPLCNLDTGACAGCLKEADCPNAQPICELLRAQCTSCASNVDCGAAAPACNLQDGKCEQCLIDADCNGAFLCGSDHKCHPACSENADCSDSDERFCNPMTRACVECLVNIDCDPGTPICRENGKCVQCEVNVDCPMALPICRKEACVECDDDKDCPADRPKCDKGGDRHACVLN